MPYDVKNIALCRICYDDDRNEKTVSPCNCAGTHAYVHMTCLKRWLSVSETNRCEICNYSFDTFELHIAIVNEETTSFADFCQGHLVWIFPLTVCCLILMSCTIEAVKHFKSTDNQDSFLNGIIMSIVSIAMAAMLILYCLIFTTIWEHVNMAIRLVDENNNATGV